MLVWIHGRGWVIGSAVESQAIARDLAAWSVHVVCRSTTASPRAQAPAALDDCVAATRWLLDNVV